MMQVKERRLPSRNQSDFLQLLEEPFRHPPIALGVGMDRIGAHLGAAEDVAEHWDCFLFAKFFVNPGIAGLSGDDAKQGRLRHGDENDNGPRVFRCMDDATQVLFYR